MKKPDDFDVMCVVKSLGEDISPGMLRFLDMSPAYERRYKSRGRRFVLTHPLVTAAHRRAFNQAAKKQT